MKEPVGEFAIVVMGPSGSGKSTLARGLTQHLRDALFIEGDDYHSPANIKKLSSGIPLSEEDRCHFIDSVGMALRAANQPAVASCSALRRVHRERLRHFASNILFVWIDVPPEELQRRVKMRPDHFMPASLLSDQLATFEPPSPPECFVKIDGMLGPGDQISALLDHIAASHPHFSRTAASGG